MRFTQPSLQTDFSDIKVKSSKGEGKCFLVAIR